MTDTDSKVFTVSVNYDDPRWRELKSDTYEYVNKDLKLEHFPVGGHGVSKVVMEYIIFNYEPTTREILDEINSIQNWSNPGQEQR